MIVTRLLSRLSQNGGQHIDYDSLLPPVPFCAGIPKRIVQTCRDKESLPEEIQSNISAMRSTNTDWTYSLFDDSMILEYIKSVYGDRILAYYSRISPEYGAAKADLFRYLYIYHEGGVYIDIKSTITKPLSEGLLPDDSFILSYWDNLEGERHFGTGHYSDVFNDFPRGEIPQWFIVAAKGHPVLRDVIINVLENIDNYNPYVNGVGWTGTVFTTGPVPYSLTIYNNIDKYPYRLVNAFSDLGLVYSVYEGINSDKTFHAKAIKSDYRKGRTPIIRHKSHVINIVNEWYLRAMVRYGDRRG